MINEVAITCVAWDTASTRVRLIEETHFSDLSKFTANCGASDTEFVFLGDEVAGNRFGDCDVFDDHGL